VEEPVEAEAAGEVPPSMAPKTATSSLFETDTAAEQLKPTALFPVVVAAPSTPHARATAPLTATLPMASWPTTPTSTLSPTPMCRRPLVWNAEGVAGGVGSGAMVEERQEEGEERHVREEQLRRSKGADGPKMRVF